MRRAVLALAILVRQVPARRIFAHLLHGTNCTARLDKDECIVNPLFMQDQCPGECDHLQYVDMLPECRLNLQACYGRNHEGSYFVRSLCNATCRQHFLEVEDALAPSDAVVLLHAVLPPLYLLAFAAVVVLQLLTGKWADCLMLWLERRRASAWAAHAQAGVLWLGERSGTRSAARHVGRLFVCGYFVVEGGLLFGTLAVLAFALPRRLRPATYGLLCYSAAEAASVVANVTLRMAVTGQFYMNELMVKKAGLLGVLVLFQAQTATGASNLCPEPEHEHEHEHEPYSVCPEARVVTWATHPRLTRYCTRRCPTRPPPRRGSRRCRAQRHRSVRSSSRRASSPHG